MNIAKLIKKCLKLNETIQETSDAMQDALERLEHDENEDYDLSCLSEDERKTFTELLLKVEEHNRIKPIRSDRISP